MINSMPSRVATSAAFLIVTCLFSVNLVQAEIGHSVQITVPFDFYVGDTMLPAGDYQVATFVNNWVRVGNPARHPFAAIPTIPVGKVLGEIVSPKLIFTQYGQDYFLSEMWWGKSSLGRVAMTSKREAELTKTIRPVRIEETARH
jgi:hypothetical protein